MQNSYDIFISYRRESGEDKARILNQHLSAAGYNVFFDHEASITGQFESVILAAVDVAPVFVIILTPGCFDRCVNEDDWVRREIETALRTHKKVIPVNPNNSFSFVGLDNMPECIEQLKGIQYAEIDFHRHFKITANEMIKEHIAKVIEPSMPTEGGKHGAYIHFFSDISCRVLAYGKQIAVTDAADKTVGAVARLRKGRHRLECKSIENEADSCILEYVVPDNEYEDYCEITLKSIRDSRINVERTKTSNSRIESKVERDKFAENFPATPSKKRDKSEADIVFCYARMDARTARMISDYLSRIGYMCIMDMDGNSLNNENEAEKIRRAQCVVMFNSHETVKAGWFEQVALSQLSNGGKLLIVRVNNAPVPPAILNTGKQFREFVLNEHFSVTKFWQLLKEMHVTLR